MNWNTGFDVAKFIMEVSIGVAVAIVFIGAGLTSAVKLFRSAMRSSK